MPRIHSHPAHRNPQDGFRLREEADAFVEAVRLIAETPTTDETPGVARDHLSDELIALARRWAAREDRSAKMLADLEKE